MQQKSPPVSGKLTRRRFLNIAGLAGVLGAAGCVGGNGDESTATPEPTPTSTATPASEPTETITPTDTPSETPTETETESTPEFDLPSSFVERDGTNFVINGERYVFSGVANCCIAEGYTSRSRVDTFFNAAERVNTDVIRFKIGSAGGQSNCGRSVDGCDLSFQPEPGEYNKTAFKHLDYIIAEAGKRGIRVILPFVDNWGATGMDRYIAWSESASEHDDFYSDDRVQELYRGFIEQLVTRTNTITGREYRDDPTILMWELANEPRVDSRIDPFRTWIEDTAQFIHELDENHLVSTGSDIYPEEAYVQNHAINGIDACSIHLWPQNWDKTDNPATYGTNYITNRAQHGFEDVGKPVYLGEYGWRVNLQDANAETQIQRRNEMFATWHDAAVSANIDGALVWELLSDSRLEYHRTKPGKGETVGFACPEHTGTCEELRSFAERMDEQSAAE